jgi:UDP-N-acetylglucosamine 2-epimerase
MGTEKVVSIVGVRPNFVKLAALSDFLDSSYEHVIVHTGQHYDYELSEVFFKCLKLPVPHYNLGVGSESHGYQLGEMIKRTEEVLLKEKSDLIIVYGDANSTLAGALAAVKLHIKIAHVEAGYRSYDKDMPEEVNRVLTDQVSDLLFAPTKTTLGNLKRENVYLTGDVMVDVLLTYKDTADCKSKILGELGVLPRSYILVTFHRESNTRNRKRIIRIVQALSSLGGEFTLVFPMHPRTKNALERFGLFDKLVDSDKIIITSPLNYLDFIKLEKNAERIVTDSGGVQKEAYVLGVPCITLRNTTGCVETVQEGWNTLVDVNVEELIANARGFNPESGFPREALGKGDASTKICRILTSYFEGL